MLRFAPIAALLTLSAACAEDPPAAPVDPGIDPWTVMPSAEIANQRGLRAIRTIVHGHSPYSHDACDGDPFPGGIRNEQCFEEARRGMCLSGQDIVFLTDHSNNFADHEFPDVLLYAAGDTLIERGGLPVANRIACDDGHEVIVAAGTESGMMPIGLEHHVGHTHAERRAAYGETGPAAIATYHDAGALVFLQHTEGWPVPNVVDWPIDGIEIYNLHQNMMDNLAEAVILALELVANPDKVPVPELGMLPIFQENEADLHRWARAVEVRRQAGMLASDAHQNVFNEPTWDGERLDSFRRLMRWFSNYTLVPDDAPLDDLLVKQAISEGRSYGAFDYLGYPVGFDFHASADGQLIEVGGEAPAALGATLTLTPPTVWGLHPKADGPVIRTLILKANDGDWEVVAEGAGELVIEVGPGVYRAEVRMVPHHWRAHLGSEPDTYLRELIWIYSNPVYIGMSY